jgi:pimeloyl-ACP methyl ester carboxylesterase
MMRTTLPRYKTANNIAYYRAGNGPILLMIHGVGLRLESWAAQIRFLSKKFTVIAVDLPGHGESNNLHMKPSNLDAYVQEIKLFANEVIEGSCIVIGHSLGALIALSYADQYDQECDGIIALNCIYQRTDEAMRQVRLRSKKLATKDMNQEIEVTIKRWFGESPTGYYLELANICRQWLLESNKEGYVEAYDIFAKQRGVSKSKLVTNNLPIAFITGTLDSNSTPSMTGDMAKLCPLGIAREVIGAGHMTQMTHAEEVNEIIQSFALSIKN